MNTPDDKARARRLDGIRRDLRHAYVLTRNRRDDLRLRCKPLYGAGFVAHQRAMSLLDSAAVLLHEALDTLAPLS